MTPFLPTGGGHGGHRRHHNNNHHSHGHHGRHQSHASSSFDHLNNNGPPGIGSDIASSMKIPPPWSPEWESKYSFRIWFKDVMAWAGATDLAEGQMASAVVLRLGGAARDLAR